MEMDLTPKETEALIEGDGGGYYIWSSSQMANTNVGAGQLLLQPRGFALPHYADSSKLGYVVQGSDGITGMVLPNTKKEVILKLKKGDIIPVPIGALSWWFNDGDSDSEDLIITFLGETSYAHVPGQFTYFFLTGLQGLIGSFSSELTSKVYGLNKDEVNKLTKSQTGIVIIKLENGQPMPKPQVDPTKEFVYNIDDATPNTETENGGLVTILTDKYFPFIGEAGLSVVRVKLEHNAIKAPSNLLNPGIQLLYIARGFGKIEIVGFNGKRVLDTQVKAGQLIVVPHFFAVAQIAGEEGMESYSVITNTKPLFEELGGKTSVWGALSPSVQQVSLNVDSVFQKLFISKTMETTNVIPPTI